MSQPPAERDEIPAEARSQFVQYLFFKTDPLWRRLPADVRERGRAEFARVVRDAAPAVTTAAYSMLALKTTTDFMLWWKADEVDQVQETLSALLVTGLGQYCQVAHSLFGLTRPSVYTKRRTAQG